MSNTQQNPTQKTPGNDYSNQSKQGTSGQKGRENSFEEDEDFSQQRDGNMSSGESNLGSMKNNAQGKDPLREREEENRPRADNK